MRCTRCNSENPPEYKFCGMCGTSLDQPAASAPVRNEAPRVAEAPRPVSPQSQELSGPSFLGLSGPARDTREDFSYLLEDEQPKRTYWRFLLLLLILGIGGGLVWLQYSRAGSGWTPPWANQKPTTPVDASQQPSQQAPPATQQANNTAQPPAGTGAAPAGEQPANAPGNPPQPKESDIPPAAGQPANGAENQQPPPASTSSDQPEAPPATANADKKQTPAAKSDSADEAAPAETEEAEAPPPKKSVKPSGAKPAAAVAASPDDALVSSAENYLYGRGVPQNCDRAIISLRSAAGRQNVRAFSLLGTMYATGHCVSKDLPNAYRWFALASRQQGDNMWVQKNLEMIWREMTPQERQLATQRSQ